MTTLPRPTEAAASEPGSRQQGWASVAALAPGAFALATTEFIPLGLVQHVSAEFSVALGSAGLMVLVPGLVAAAAAPLAVVVAGQLSRKPFVLTLAAVLLASNVS